MGTPTPSRLRTPVGDIPAGQAAYNRQRGSSMPMHRYQSFPPIDLAECCRTIRLKGNRVYDWSFVRQLRKEVTRLHATFPDLDALDLGAVKTLYDFDDLYTAPRGGFAGASDYYAQSSVATMISRILVPGLVIHAENDPFIPAELFRRIVFPARLALELNLSGGHLGYLSARPWEGDRRWLDSRLTSWLAARWALR